MKLNIHMTIKAVSKASAESIAMEALAEMALKAGCAIAIGNGDTTMLSKDTYKLTIVMDITNGNNIQNASHMLMDKPNIVSAFVFANEETKKETEHEPEHGTARYVCKECGAVCFDYAEGTIINPKTENEYFLCDDCLESAEYEGTVELCSACKEYVSDFVENPVTHKKNICPICGDTLWT